MPGQANLLELSMVRMFFRGLWLALLAWWGLVAAVACGDSLGLPPAQFGNVVDTTTLFALTGTPISAPSGYDVVNGVRSRTDLNQPFDFAVDIDAGGRPLVIPPTVLGRSDQSALQLSTDAFDSIRTAPLEGYQADSAQPVSDQTVFIVRSRAESQFCIFLGALPRYGKFRVLAIDLQARSITFELLVNRNCGFRGLEPGVPTS